MASTCHFVGAIPPRAFLDRFMDSGHRLPPIPSVDYTPICAAKSDQEAQQCFIRIVESAHICPQTRFFLPKLKRRQLEAFAERRPKEVANGYVVCDEDTPKVEQALLPPYPSVAGRKHCGKPSKSPRKNLCEYYNFATTSIGVEVTTNWEGDPFADPEDYAYWPSPTPPRLEGRGSRFDAPQSPPIMSPDAPRITGKPISDAPEASTSRQAAMEHIPENASSRHRSPSGESLYEKPFERDYPEAAAMRARLLKSAQALFDRQHRCRLFYLILVDGCARFLLFDRAGAIVSRRFDYLKSPELLTEFLWRFSHMDDSARGKDCSVMPASHQEASVLITALEDFVSTVQESRTDDLRRHVLPHAEASRDNSDTYPFWKIHVTGGYAVQSTDLVVCKPFSGQSPLFGRSTRAYFAYDVKQRKLVFLKDSWRTKDPRLRPEFDMYRDLRANGVPFVPDVLYGGDVCDSDAKPQETIIDELSVEEVEWRSTDTQLEGYVHHRIVQDILYPLTAVRDERELIQAMHDAISAIDKTYLSLGVIHRDLTHENVMLDSRGRCVLGDWDHAARPNQDLGATGTIPFMSIRLLKDESLQNELVDDLQSVFWVLNYVSVMRFALHYDDLSSNLFVDGGVDRRMRIAASKLISLGKDSLYKGRYSSAALAGLIEDVSHAWSRYQYALTGPTRALGAAAAPPQYEMLELAAQPEYWLGKFAAALRRYDAEAEAAHGAESPVAGSSRGIHARAAPETPSPGIKRKSMAPPPEEVQTVRRSKRLRAMRQRQLQRTKSPVRAPQRERLLWHL